MKSKRTNEIIVLLLLAIGLTTNTFVSKTMIVEKFGDQAFTGMMICTLLTDVVVAVCVGILIAKSRKEQKKA